MHVAQTHPQYRLTYYDGVETRVSCDADTGPRTLDAAADKAARINALADQLDAGLLYGIEPIPGTEPRYWLTCTNDLGNTPRRSAWHPSLDPLPWADAKAAYEYRTARYAEFAHADSRWPLTYRVVQS